MKQNAEKNFQEAIIFTGSPVEDVEHAKSFWKSLTLQPPLESRLVSAEIRQRMRAAPPPSRHKPVRNFFSRKEKEHKEFMEKCKNQEHEKECKKYHILAQKRQEALELLERQRTQRLAKEMIRDKVSRHRC